MKKYKENEEIFDIIDTPEKSYWLGFIFADGYIRYPYAFGIEISDIDREHLEKFKKFISSNGIIRKTRKNCCKIEIGSKYLVESLSKYGIVQNKTYITTILPTINDYLFKFFILGLLDGDGWISEHKIKKTGLNQYEFGFSSYHITIIQIIKNWFEKQLNKKCGYISARPGKCVQYIIGGIDNFYKIYHLLYDDSIVSLERKRNKADSFIKIIEERIKSR